MPCGFIYMSVWHESAGVAERLHTVTCSVDSGWPQWKLVINMGGLHAQTQTRKSGFLRLMGWCWQQKLPMTHVTYAISPPFPSPLWASVLISICQGNCSHGRGQRPGPTCHSLFASGKVNKVFISCVGFAAREGHLHLRLCPWVYTTELPANVKPAPS